MSSPSVLSKTSVCCTTIVSDVHVRCEAGHTPIADPIPPHWAWSEAPSRPAADTTSSLSFHPRFVEPVFEPVRRSARTCGTRGVALLSRIDTSRDLERVSSVHHLAFMSLLIALSHHSVRWETGHNARRLLREPAPERSRRTRKAMHSKLV